MKKIYILFQLILFISCFNSYGQHSEQEALSGAKETLVEIDKNNRYVDNISAQNIASLPIGIKSKVGGDNTTYTIGVSKARFYPTYTELTVFAKIDIPQKGEDGLPMSLFFGAEDIKLSHDGGIIGDAKLALLGDINIPITNNTWQISLFGGFDKQTGKIEDLTYVIIDCDGFKELKVSGAVEFSKNIILPIVQGKVIDQGGTTPVKLSNGRLANLPNRVRGTFDFTASSWNDMLFEVSLSPFVLTKKQNGTDYNGNFQFLVNKAILDLSDIRNSSNVVFPNSYHQNGLLFPNQETWKGVYIETLDVALPKEFKTQETAKADKRIHIGASQMLIDKFGVSGSFYATNIFTLDQGITDRSNSWAYSLDSLSVTLETNKLVKGSLRGEIILPVTKMKQKTDTLSASSGFRYNGLISESEYSLTVSNTNKINFDIWKAKATLAQNSSIQLKVKEGRFLPKAVLHGSIDFSASKSSSDEDNTELTDSKKTVDFKGITFDNLALQTVYPMIQIGNMGYKDNLKFGNFPVSIGNIEIVALDNRADLYFDLALNLMDSSELKADARLGIKGSLVNLDERQRWKFSGLDLSKIEIKGNFSGFKIEGRLDLLENHPIYGKGFNADLDVEVTGAFAVHAKAIFGKKDFRYWYFDASAKLTGASFLINGFGGGAYYKMKRSAFADPTEFSPSGLTYEPYEDAGLGLKALVSFGIGDDKAFSAEAAFEFQFNKRGGLNFAAIYGKGNVLAEIPGLDNIQNLVKKVNSSLESSVSFMNLKTKTDERTSFENRFLPLADSAIPKLPDSKEAAIKVKAAIQFDIANRTTHGTLDVFINAGFISGVGPNGRAGWAVFHKDPRDWYLYIGTPDDRIGIKMGVAGISLQTGSYLMAGTQLPGSPPPPDHVARILGVDAEQLNYMRDENQLANAGGFAFGSNLSIDTGDLSFLIFYANFKAGVGFDIMLKDYGEAACSNTGDTIGIDGWYANGQSYAYLQGELGVRVKLLFVRLKIPIISAGAAVVMQAKLPNPFWMRGYVGGYMNVLGGLIKGKFSFKVTIGEECEFENGGALAGIKMIMDVSPKDMSEDVDVFAVPQATFAMRVNQPIELPNDKGDVEVYKVVLEKFDVVSETGVTIEGKLEWSSLKDRANFISTDILPPNTNFKALVEVSFQKLENGIFQPVKEKGELVKELEERAFKTGGAPDHIPLTNIEYSYPVVKQNYFFKNEYKDGYVKLKRGQDYLFEDDKWETKVKIIDKNSDKSFVSSFNYNTSDNELYYQMPKIATKSNYKFIIISTVKDSQAIASKKSDAENIDSDENDFRIENKKSEELIRDGEIERLSYEFTTSKFKKFVDKINAISVANHNFIIHSADVISLSNSLRDGERFDEIELLGTGYSNNIPLVQVEAKLDDSYFLEDINPMLYAKLPIGGVYTISQREVAQYGLVPAKAISINNFYVNSVINELNLESTAKYFPYEYDLPLIYKRDLFDITNQISNDVAKGKLSANDPAFIFLNSKYKFMQFGKYNLAMKYVLPGDKAVSEAVQVYKNLIK